MFYTAPAVLSLEEFKAISLEVGNWLWGTMQGAFNERATTAQILTDAVIGICPGLGDITATRDLIAVVIGLRTDPRKREDAIQWILLVVLLFALLPYIGGVIKGVGRLLLKVMVEAAQLVGAGARAAHMARAAQDIVAFLNRVGIGNAEHWLKGLRITAHESTVMKKLHELFEVIVGTLQGCKARFGDLLPQALVDRIDGLVVDLKLLDKQAIDMVPEAIKQLDESLREIQAYIRSGGETTSRATTRTATAGVKNLSYTDELILMEGRGATRSARGGMAQNSGHAKDIGAVYEPKAGFPDLMAHKKPPGWHPNITTFAGKIVNRNLQKEETIFRVFGPGGTTLGDTVGKNFPAGDPTRVGSPSFWGLGKAPDSGGSWRHGSAVLDEWNSNGFILTGTVLEELPACTGVVAEQLSTKTLGQHLRGGAKQAMITFDKAVVDQLASLGDQVIDSGRSAKIELGGVAWEIRPTHWDDVNGVHGYQHMPGPKIVQTSRLGDRELTTKRDQHKDEHAPPPTQPP